MREFTEKEIMGQAHEWDEQKAIPKGKYRPGRRRGGVMVLCGEDVC